jgi:hypothetical protein
MTLSTSRVGFLYLITLALCATNVFAGNEDLLTLQLPSGQELEIKRFAGSEPGKSRVLWLPSERGISKAHAEHAAALANMGHEVWLADLHDAYFVERNRRSISQFPLQDIVALISAAVSDPDAEVVLVSSSMYLVSRERKWYWLISGRAGAAPVSKRFRRYIDCGTKSTTRILKLLP